MFMEDKENSLYDWRKVKINLIVFFMLINLIFRFTCISKMFVYNYRKGDVSDLLFSYK